MVKHHNSWYKLYKENYYEQMQFLQRVGDAGLQDQL
jgi:hypothetical protein